MVHTNTTDDAKVKDLEKKLRESELQFKALADSLPGGLFITDKDGAIVYQNQRFWDYTGRSPDEAEGWKWKDLPIVHPDDMQKTVTAWKAALERGDYYQVEFRLRRFDGEYRWFTSRAFPYRDDSGEIVRWYGTNTEIHEQKMSEQRALQSEARLRESESRFRNLANALPQIIWIARPDGYVNWYNKWYFDYTGLSPDSNWDDPDVSPIHPEDTDNLVKQWTKSLQTGQPTTIEFRIKRKSDGMYRWHLSRGVPQRNNSGEIENWVGSNTDIHDQKIALEKLKVAEMQARQQRERAELATSTSGMGLYELNLKTNLLELPKAIADVYELPPGIFDAEECFKRIHPDDVDFVRATVKKAIEERTELNLEARITPPSGKLKWLSISGRVILDQNGEPTALLGVNVDITERKHAEEEIAKTAAALEIAKSQAEQASQLKSSFLANMSHEIRTPLGAILGFSALLKDKNLETHEKEHYIDTILRNGSALTRIIDDILDLAKVEAGKLETEEVPFSLYQLTLDVVDLFKDKTKEKGIDLLLNIDENVPPQVCSDPSRLRQILVNLIGNSIKFTHQGSVRVVVRVEDIDRKKIRVIIDVKDTGIGLSREQKEKLFTPFMQADNTMTRKFGGTGLGLALSQRLSQALHGEISIPQSELGKGSTFRLSFIANLPKNISNSEARTKSDPTATADLTSLEGLRILVVDDSPDNQFLVSRLLTKRGAHIETALDGEEALHKALEREFDVILMDIQMPRMDGYQAKRELDLRGYKKPVIALTAHAMSDERARTKAAGFAGHLTKPLVAKELINAIAQHVHLEH